MAGDGSAAASGVVVVCHGGQEQSTQPTSDFQLAVLRMIPVARAVQQSLRGSGVEVRRPRFRLRGWNGAQAAPVRDLNQTLNEIGDRLGPAPVVLIGHSMGARAALRAAGHPGVVAVAALAPWLPAGEPVGQLAGRRILLVHGSADTLTSPGDTWAFAERARSVTTTTAIELLGGEHTMLRRARLWHSLAAGFACTAFGLPGGDGAAGDALEKPAAARRRVTL